MSHVTRKEENRLLDLLKNMSEADKQKALELARAIVCRDYPKLQEKVS